jgi:hypothetical protein
MQGETGPPYSSLAKRNAKKREKISQGETGPPDSLLEETRKKIRLIGISADLALCSRRTQTHFMHSTMNN